MNQTVQLKAKKFPDIVASLIHSNEFLKMFSILALALTLLTLGLVAVLATKPPKVVAFSTDGSPVGEAPMPKVDELVRAAVRRYLEKRYQWGPSTVKQRLQEAEAFVLRESRKPFEAAMTDIVKFSTEKSVFQKVFPEKIEVDPERQVVRVTGDRITMIQGLKAAGDLRLELSFVRGPYTKENPWGFYVSQEREE